MQSDIIDNLLRHLSPADLIRYSLASKTVNHSINTYRRRAFNLHDRLSHFFTPTEIRYFRYWQSRTGMLISGSTALQFFDRSHYPGSDLDVYVEHRYAGVIAHWFQSIGYTFEHRKAQDPDFHVAFNNTRKTLPDALIFHPSAIAGYFGRGVANVFDFFKYNPSRKIQLITSFHSPLEVILHFHSTCVMNIISHSTAYALYPKATFEQRRSLICATTGSKQENAREKYIKRGWTMEPVLSPDELRDCSSDYRTGNRWIGDGACWTIPILPELDFDVLDHVRTNTWGLFYSRKLEARMAFLILESPNLRFSYLVADEEVADHIEPVVMADSTNKKFYDDDLKTVMVRLQEASKRYRVNSGDGSTSSGIVET